MSSYNEHYCSELEDEIGRDVSKPSFYWRFITQDTLPKMKKSLNPFRINFLDSTESVITQVISAGKAFFWAFLYVLLMVLRVPFGWLFVLYLDLGRIGKAWNAYNEYLEDQENEQS